MDFLEDSEGWCPKNIHVLVHETCEYAVLQGKEESGLKIESNQVDFNIK